MMNEDPPQNTLKNPPYTEKQIKSLLRHLSDEPRHGGRSREYFVLVKDPKKFQDFLQSADPTMYKPRINQGKIDITRTIVSKYLLRFYYDQPQTFRNVQAWLAPFGLIPKSNEAYADEFLALIRNEIPYEDSGSGSIVCDPPKSPFPLSKTNPQSKLQNSMEEEEQQQEEEEKEEYKDPAAKQENK